MPNFTYITGIPAASHNPSTDQPDMQINTNSIDDIIEVDHYSFNDNNGGYHKKVSLVNNAGPFPTPGGVGSVLYGSGNEWIFTTAALAGAGIQMTLGTKPPIALPRGSTFLPGGLLLQWGSGATAAGVFNDTYTYPMTTTFGIFSGVQSGTGTTITNASILTGGPPPYSNVSVIAKFTNGSFVTNGTIVYWLAVGQP